MRQITVTRKENREAFDALVFCQKAKHSVEVRGFKVDSLQVKRNRLVATDGGRLHFAPVKGIPSGLYDYEKKNTTITLTPVKGKYAPVEEVIPKTYTHKVKIDREGLMHRLRFAKILCNNAYHGAILNFNGKLDIKVVNPDLGEMNTDIETKGTVEPELRMGVNPNFILDALRSFKDKVVTIGLQDKDRSPLVFIGKNRTALVMPMRI
jgi:hypothetical protein